MKILFCRIPAHFGVENSHPENSMIPIELSIMISIAKSKGFETELLDLEAETYSLSDATNIINRNYDYIVVRAKTPSYGTVKKLFENCNSKVIGVGHLFSTKGSKIYELTSIPLVCGIKGEADYPFNLLLDCLLAGKSISDVPNLIYLNSKSEIISNKNVLLESLDDLPAPNFDLFKNLNYYTFYATPFGQKKNYGFLMQSRGCPYSCTFCSPTLRNSYGKGMRYHSVDRVVQDMRNQKRLGKTILYFRDDIFTINRARTIELCEKIIQEKINISWCCQTHINNIDEELLLFMRNAGCVSIGFGLESGSKKILDTVKKTNKIEKAPALIKYARSINLKVNCFFLIGCPGETKEDHDLTMKLLKSCRPDLIQVAFFTPYPGSEDYQTYFLESDQYDTNLHHYNNYKINYTKMRSEDVIKFQKKLYLTWLLYPRTIINLSLSVLSDLLYNRNYLKFFLQKGTRFLFCNILSKRKSVIETKI